MAASGMRHTTLRLAQVPSEGPTADFEEVLARGLADLDNEHARYESLTLRLSLSNWMRRSEANFGSTKRELLQLRRALLRCSGLDADTEPVPLAARDDARTVLNLAVYILGLIDRSARSAGLDRGQVVEAALGSA
jgi:hypothetical protein